MYYKNVSLSVKTFHGVTFKPGETKEVNQYINHKFMILVDKPEIQPSTEHTSQQSQKQQKPSSEKAKKVEEKKGSEALAEGDGDILPESDTNS